MWRLWVLFSFVVEQDYFSTINKDDGDQRDITVLMYLTDVTEGGETIFPKGTWATEGAQGSLRRNRGEWICEQRWRQDLPVRIKG